MTPIDATVAKIKVAPAALPAPDRRHEASRTVRMFGDAPARPRFFQEIQFDHRTTTTGA